MPFTAVRQERLYLKVAEQIAAFIRRGDITPGTRLPSERDLAQQFSVSRPTIREAMIALELAGHVEIRSGSGVYVHRGEGRLQQLARDEAPGPLEILEARLYIEGDAAALAALRAQEEDLLAIGEAFAAIQREDTMGQGHDEADERFHLLIARASGNSALHASVAQLWKLRRTSAMSVFFHDRLRARGVKPVIDDHRRILKALQRRDPAAAREAMRAHLQNVIDVVVDDDGPEENAA